MYDQQPAFLDKASLKVLRMMVNEYTELQWKAGKWIFDVSDEANKIYLYTFSGEKINRALSILLSAKLNAAITYEYRKLIIDFGKERPISIADIKSTIMSFKDTDLPTLSTVVSDKIKVKWFSKFSECIPEQLAKQTILDKDYDFAGLKREFENIVIE